MEAIARTGAATSQEGFVYSSQEYLAASQRVLVDLKTHLTESLELCTFEELSDYYSSLVLLLKQPELNFAMLLPDSFQGNPTTDLLRSATSKILASASVARGENVGVWDK